MRLPSPAPGASRRRCSAARTSASIRCTCACRPRVRAVLDLLSLVTFASFIALITWHAWGVVRQSYVSGSRSLSELETPVVIPQALWFAGLVFFVAVALLLLARSLHALLTGDLPKLFELIGSKSAVAEAEEEVRATERAMDSEAASNDGGDFPHRAAGRARQLDRGRGRHGADGRHPQPALSRRCRSRASRASSPGRRRPISFSPPYPSTSCSARSCCAAALPGACTPPWCRGSPGCRAD